MTSMEVDCLKGDWGLPSIDLKCLHVMTYAHFVDAPITFKKDTTLWRNPTAPYPIFQAGGTILKNSGVKVIDYLKGKNFNADAELSHKDRADILAYSALLEERLLPALHYLWWGDAKNHVEFSRPWYSKTFHFPFNYFLPGMLHRAAEERLECTRGGENVLPEELRHRVFKDARECLNLLSEKLGDQPFFFGESPSSLDALVFSYLAPLLRVPLPNNELKDHIKQKENLWVYCSRILQRYYPLSPEEEAKQGKGSTETTGVSVDEDPHRVRNIVLSVAFALTALVSYSLMSGLIQLEIASVDDHIDADFDEEEHFD